MVAHTTESGSISHSINKELPRTPLLPQVPLEKDLHEQTQSSIAR